MSAAQSQNAPQAMDQLRQERASLENMLRQNSQQHVHCMCVRSETPEILEKIRSLERQRDFIARRLSLVNCMYGEQCLMNANPHVRHQQHYQRGYFR